MVFSSTVFLFIFLPIVYLLYLIVKNLKARNIILIIASLFFYAYGEPVAVVLMILSVIMRIISTKEENFKTNNKKPSYKSVLLISLDGL